MRWHEDEPIPQRSGDSRLSDEVMVRPVMRTLYESLTKLESLIAGVNAQTGKHRYRDWHTTLHQSVRKLLVVVEDELDEMSNLPEAQAQSRPQHVADMRRLLDTLSDAELSLAQLLHLPVVAPWKPVMQEEQIRLKRLLDQGRALVARR